MRLPLLDEIADEDQLLLLQHDQEELHGEQNTPTRIKYLRQYEISLDLIQGLEPWRVLDLGCAQGNVAIGLSEHGFHVVACDLRAPFLEYARMKGDLGDGDFVAADAYHLPFEAQSFDVVFAGDLLEHLAFPQRVLSECWRILRSRGHLLLATPNGRNIFNRLPTFDEIEDRSSLSEIQCGPDADSHLFLFTSRELSRLLASSGFQMGQVRFAKSSLINNHLERVFVKTPLSLSIKLDKFLTTLPGLKQFLSEGIIVVARRLPVEVMRR